jgi:glutaredoxin 3
MPKIEVYASMWCGFCHRAKALLKSKNVDFTEYDVDSEPGRRGEMQARGGGYTVPQIFVDGKPVGGCDEIHALDRAGRLDALIGVGSAAGG